MVCRGDSEARILQSEASTTPTAQADGPGPEPVHDLSEQGADVCFLARRGEHGQLRGGAGTNTRSITLKARSPDASAV